ncbi:MAG: FtsX-like permease family protein, partial [Gemmatimonadetes bacterium]|nr:FtsX-like permease family protein [Gemmatimonadota bacterium]NIR79655.1 FtsX-like permease family protein [Gemmatimonadota bacterium]NIT88355.1 FtsX-like permease family protein [Gemmatimonadota bacterium]NIU32164.1 FtsX-like permease family protein [Gemmatimonadota bacterium]NIU36727.1 FtsX-like permease family protein [Gemmatimonadota bacterium]
AAYTPRLDARVFLVTLATAAGAGILFGLLPALQTLRRNHAGALREGSGRAGAGGSRKRLSRALVVAEIALSMVALGVGSVMVRSFLGLRAADPGYDGADVLTATISVPDSRYPEPEDRWRLADRILEHAAGIRGAASVALTSNLPQGFISATDSARIPGRTGADGDPRWQAMTILTSPGYLETMDVELVRGRFFRTADREDGPPVAVVNRTLARSRFPDRGPVGERIVVRGEARQIVGVAADVQQVLVTTPGTASGEVIYLPMAQVEGGPGTLVLETSGDPHALVAPLRAALQEIDPDLILPRVLTMTEVLDRTFTGIRVFNVILGVFGVIALFMAALGTYGVLAYTVGQRRHEIGIRLALGAEPGAVVKMISRQGILLGAVGLVLGGLGSLPLVEVLRSTLQGFSAVEPSTLAAIAALLFGVSVAASVLPARGAARVDPVETLKGE